MGFFDKLKGAAEEKPAPKSSSAKACLPAGRASVDKEEPKKKKRARPKPEKIEIKPEVIETPAAKKEVKLQPEMEGELAIDVYETDSDFYIQSTIAGVKAEDLDVEIENNMVTIRGSRQKQTIENAKKHYYQECYWGAFSRQVILPEEVDGTKTEAKTKDGVLTLRIPKISKVQKHKIKVS